MSASASESDRLDDAASVLASPRVCWSSLACSRIRPPRRRRRSRNRIDERSCFVVKQTLDRVELRFPARRPPGALRDEAGTWTRWAKAVPAATYVELSEEFRRAASWSLSEEWSTMLDVPPEELLGRLSLRLLLLPSGASPKRPLSTPCPGGISFGKLLYGGVKRFRLLKSSNSNRPPRRTSEMTATKPTLDDDAPAWVQYGGGDRTYEALDVGAAAVLELTLHPRGRPVPDLLEENAGVDDRDDRDMVLRRIAWSPRDMLGFVPDGGDRDSAEESSSSSSSSIDDESPSALSGRDRNDAYESSFTSNVGGLRPQIRAIVRRVLDGRVVRPADADVGDDDDDDSYERALSATALEADVLASLGLEPVRGLLLYGPPGCGKTALAREISRALRARAPKIVAAPELLDRWVGGSERLVRELFADAEAELAACCGDPAKSALHVVVIDEIDAVFRKRSHSEEGGEATRSSTVNQILSKLDGVNAIPNVLLIGMTNRRELLDEALLRPGRLEVQIEIPLPDKEGRREILRIHFGALRDQGRLSPNLCRAIDGGGGGGALRASSIALDDASESGAETTATVGRKRRAWKRAIAGALTSYPNSANNYDLAANSVTGGFSGADLAGLVRCAGSIALSRARRDGAGIDGLLITLDDVKQALKEVKH